MSIKERKSYKKRIASWKTSDDKAISLWLEVEKSVKVAYSVYFNYQHLHKFTREEPARAKCLEILAADGLPSSATGLPLDVARDIDKNPVKPLEGDLTIGLLIALEKLGSQEKGIGKVRLGMRDTLARRLAKLGPIPSGDVGAERWASELSALMLSSFKAQATYTARVSLLLKVLDTIDHYPVVFSRWRPAIQTVKARLRTTRSRKKNLLESEANRPPYNKTEILSLIAKQENFEQVVLLLVYLQYGFRAREAERLSPGSVRGGRIDLSTVVSKTKTDKLPPLLLLTKSALNGVEFHQLSPFRSIALEGVDRRRLRPTAVVMMTLAQQDALSVIQRTGHANIRMVINHYAKFLPDDFRVGQSFKEYAELSELRLNGTPVNESTYDQWLLFLALKEARARGAGWFIELVKQTHVPKVDSDVRNVVNF